MKDYQKDEFGQNLSVQVHDQIHDQFASIGTK